MSIRLNSDLQMLETSRGPYRLTQMINLQSKTMSLDERSQCNGNNLLKSTLDLQESLIMLGKLQTMNNVSQAATRSLMEEIEIEIIRSELGQASKRYALAVGRCNNRLHEERLCSSSRRLKNDNGELKKVIRDSLCAQSTLSNSSDDDKASSRRSHVSIASSRFDASYDVERNRDTSSTSSQQSMKMRTPNLIARLMGLEEIPSEGIQAKEENSRPQELINNTEVSKIVRKQTTVDQNLKPERATLFDIIERDRLERRIRSQRAKESRILLGSSDTSGSQLQKKESCLHEEAQQIVRMKATPCIDRRKFQDYYPPSENLNQKFGQSAKRATNEYELGRERESDPFRSPSKCKLELTYKMDEEAQSIMNFITVSSEGFQEHQIPDKISMQEFELVPPQIILDDEHDLPKGRKKNVIRKLEKTKVESPQCTKKLASANHMQNRKEAIRSSIYKSQKPNKSEMSSEKPKDSKVKRLQLSDSKTYRQATVVPDKRSSIFANANAPVNHCGTSQTKPTYRNSSTLTRMKQNEKQPAQKSNTTKPVKKKDVTTVSPSCKTVGSIRNTSCIDQHPQGKGNYMKSSITDKTRKDQKVIYEVMPKASKVPCKVETAAVPDVADIAAKFSKIEDFKGLLLKNRSFLMHAYELCTNAHQPLSDEKTNIKKEGKDEQLYLACANELLSLQSYKIQLSKHPMSTIGLKLSAYASLDQLIEVISTGIKTLSNYSEVTDDDISNDDLYVRLRKDIECKKMMVNSMWDLAWWNGISMDEADQVVGQVEEAILFSLVEETVMELLH